MASRTDTQPPAELAALQEVYKKNVQPNIKWVADNQIALIKGCAAASLSILGLIITGFVLAILAQSGVISPSVSQYFSMAAFGLPLLLLIALSCFKGKIVDQYESMKTVKNALEKDVPELNEVLSQADRA